MLPFCGITDEAGAALATQLRATHALGWRHLEMRNVTVPGFPNGNLHDVPDAAFAQVVAAVEAAGISVVALGSSIGNWASHVTDPFDLTLERVARAIPRMQRLGIPLVRVMSYAVLKDVTGGDLPDQWKAERFRRLREIVSRFSDAGLTVVHENCMNYGGMSVDHALETLEAVPGLRWVFDTGNPVFTEDRRRPGHRQQAWEFYQAVRPWISHIHIKDGVYDPAIKDCRYTLPGAGDGAVARIIEDALATGYEGFFSIEPHTAVVFHDTGTTGSEVDVEARAAEHYQCFVDYGQAFERLFHQQNSD